MTDEITLDDLGVWMDENFARTTREKASWVRRIKIDRKTKNIIHVTEKVVDGRAPPYKAVIDE